LSSIIVRLYIHDMFSHEGRYLLIERPHVMFGKLKGAVWL